MPQEFHVFYTGNGDVRIQEVLTGTDALGMATETPAETCETLKEPKNPIPEGMYAGTLEQVRQYALNNPPPFWKQIWEQIKKIRQKLY
ncbi:hypothetical protein HZA41_00275 [Candidatus Peregrinibacteria bacterium]|nr:hypothetical protein [Candidatus Peregrinibacteria bacterium]